MHAVDSCVESWGEDVPDMAISAALEDEDLLHAILSQLPLTSLCACTAVCKRWRSAASDARLWHTLDAQAVWQDGLKDKAAKMPMQQRSGLLSRALGSMMQRYGPHLHVLHVGCTDTPAADSLPHGEAAGAAPAGPPPDLLPGHILRLPGAQAPPGPRALHLPLLFPQDLPLPRLPLLVALDLSVAEGTEPEHTRRLVSHLLPALPALRRVKAWGLWPTAELQVHTVRVLRQLHITQAPGPARPTALGSSPMAVEAAAGQAAPHGSSDDEADGKDTGGVAAAGDVGEVPALQLLASPPAAPAATPDLTHLDVKGWLWDANLPLHMGGRLYEALDDPHNAWLLALLRHFCAGARLQQLRVGWRSEDADGMSDFHHCFRLTLTAALCREFARLGGSLQHLDASGAALFTGFAVGPPPAGQSLLAGLTQLVTCNLSNTRTAGNGPQDPAWIGLGSWQPHALQGLNLRGCDWVVEEHLLALLGRTPLLQRLNISCLRGVGNAVLRLLPSTCPSLQLLDVCYCRSMTATGVVQAVLQLRQLTDLGCSGFPDLTDTGLTAMLQAHTTQLTMLGAGGCPALTDMGLDALGRLCGPGLTSLYLADLTRITDAGVTQLVQACPRLQRLNVERCSAVSPGVAEALAQQYPYTYDGDTHA